MIVSLKDSLKLFGISVIACCAVFVCAMFLNYNIDLAAVKHTIVSAEGIELCKALVLSGKVTAAVSGGCLGITTVIMLIFYIKNYIDAHSKELGILKAQGYSNFEIAKHFWVFGLSVLVGCALGFFGAMLYLPTFYEKQNAQQLFPDIEVGFHPWLAFLMVALPAIVFVILSILYACIKLKKPVLELMHEKFESPKKIAKADTKDAPFLKSLSSATLKSKKMLAFFVAFSAFCFSAMVQMSASMNELSGKTFAWMVLLMGLLLAFMTLFLSLSRVVKGNAKTIAMMRVFGYDEATCSRSILGAYRPIAHVGFVIGTAYQYGILKIMMTLVFDDLENMPEYHFDFQMCIITLIAFVVTYELVMYLYSRRLKKLSIKSIMME